MIKEEDISIHNKAIWLFPTELKTDIIFHGEHFYDNDDSGFEFSLKGFCRLDIPKDPMNEDDFVSRFNWMLSYSEFKFGLFDYIFSEGWNL